MWMWHWGHGGVVGLGSAQNIPHLMLLDVYSLPPIQALGFGKKKPNFLGGSAGAEPGDNAALISDFPSLAQAKCWQIILPIKQ